MSAGRNDIITLDWKPDKNSSVSIRQQIVVYFGNQISSGNWISGQRLPSQRRMAELFAVNRSTVAEAMDALGALGLVEGDFGGGTRVASDGWALLVQDKAPDWQSYITGGGFRPNVPTVQTVNKLEFEEGITRMSTGELSPELMQRNLTKQVLASLSDRELFMNYPDPLGMPALREAIRQHLKKSGIDAPISNILIVSGALQALQLISMGIVRPKARVYIESPSYLGSLNIFQSVGAELKGVPILKRW